MTYLTKTRHVVDPSGAALADLVAAGLVEYTHTTNPTGDAGHARHVYLVRDPIRGVVEHKQGTSQFPFELLAMHRELLTRTRVINGASSNDPR